MHVHHGLLDCGGLIEFYRVSKRYPGGRLALDDVSFKVARGEFVFLTGASGAGKSTLLALIYCGQAATSGQVLVNGRHVSSLPRRKVPFLRRTMGVVFQDFRLIGRRTVFENVSYLPRLLGLGARAQREMAQQTLRRVGLAHRMTSFPSELSAGEQQRVAIARALISDPALLLADEPTGNLDPGLAHEVLRLFREINRRATTVCVATHDRHLIEAFGGRVLTLRQGMLAGDEILIPAAAAAAAEALGAARGTA